jgi:CBS domain-containing protein
MHDELEATLEGIAGQLRTGGTPSTLTVRQFISLIGAERRGYAKVQTLRQALARHGLATVPDFESAYMDSPIALVASADEAAVAQTLGDERLRDDVAADVAAYSDPTYRVSKLRAANQRVVSVKLSDSLETAVTQMRMGDFSQLPVMAGEREVKGAVTWKGIASRLAAGHPAGLVSDFMDPCAEVDAAASLFRVIGRVVEHDFVVVRGLERRITGIVTPIDLDQQFQQLTEPFLLLGKIENHVRRLIGDRFTCEELQAGCDPNGAPRAIEEVADLTFGEYIRLLENRDRWTRLGVSFDRVTVIKKLEDVREIRNDVMHFDPDGIADEQLHVLREVARFFQDQRAMERRQPRPTVPAPLVAPPPRAAVPGSSGRSRKGQRRKELIYLPSLWPTSFIHLSTAGDSYALRMFDGGRVEILRDVPGCMSTDELLTRHPAVHQIDVADEGKLITGEDEYWCARIAELNRQYGIG